MNPLTLPGTLLILLLVQASDPVPPQRVDPTATPDAPANDPIQPTDGRQASQDATGGDEAATRDLTPAFVRPALRIREAPSIFTDEAYRNARVRSLLLNAMDGYRR